MGKTQQHFLQYCKSPRLNSVRVTNVRMTIFSCGLLILLYVFVVVNCVFFVVANKTAT